jgi:hypothetical protein
MDSLLSFPVGLFHPLQTCRFIPTLSGCAVIQELTASGWQNGSLLRDANVHGQVAMKIGISGGRR